MLVNATDVCNGTITRQRKTLKKTETSVLDYFIVCRKLFEMIKEMIIDEDRKFVLTKYTSKKGEQKTVESDHNPMWCRFDIPWVTFVKSDRKIGFNLKDTQSQQAFKEYNTQNPRLINSLVDSDDIVSGGKKWFKELQDSIFRNFKKIRFSENRKDKHLEERNHCRKKEENRSWCA